MVTSQNLKMVLKVLGAVRQKVGIFNVFLMKIESIE